MTPGLANKICIPAATKVCCNFPETLNHLPKEKAVLTGSPIRRELFQGVKQKGLEYCNFNDQKPILLIIGGEKRGISSSVLNKADQIVRIYYGRRFDAALSAASAATILAFEVFKSNK